MNLWAIYCMWRKEIMQCESMALWLCSSSWKNTCRAYRSHDRFIYSQRGILTNCLLAQNKSRKITSYQLEVCTLCWNRVIQSDCVLSNTPQHVKLKCVFSMGFCSSQQTCSFSERYTVFWSGYATFWTDMQFVGKGGGGNMGQGWAG